MKIDTVICFLQEVEKHPSAMMFRGQSDSEWHLTPSLARLNPKKFPIKLNDGWKGAENHLINEFKKYALTHLKVEPKNKLEWLIQAQHHGLPTRLLDWSTNPLKALYFAVENSQHDHTDGKVFIYTPRMWSTSSDNMSNIDRDNTIEAFFPVAINDRVLAQEGCFTLFPQQESFDPIKPFVEGFSTSDAVGMFSLIIDKEAKSDLRKQLARLGVSDMSLFPDLDGISKKICRDFGAL
ncbi:FRG domain-containing protein [Endozoicomonas sp. OPT23]|uniref:FRG domain-containing protein n=1 Tax=Endozoicomonas sp. OPT23 TaxID=2072845 RepID=UPI00129B6535|nr:FRG domain-containing protein [Endozoicomonas sp. OPT23]MRI35436.1 FRG domain-containing protein [Endozoicomonas sp. OPT23]